MLLGLLLVGCEITEENEVTIEQGTVFACLEDGSGQIFDEEVEIEATVRPSSAATSTCAATRTLELAEADGTTWVLGFEVRDGDGVDVTPELEVAPGDTVSLLFRNKLVWGDVSGFVLEDFESALIVAADGGSWGGALQPGEVDGLVVERGDAVLGSEDSDCQPVEGFDITFSADEATVLTPVESRIIQMGGHPFTAIAASAWDYGESDDCSMSDATGFTAWAVVR